MALGYIKLKSRSRKIARAHTRQLQSGRDKVRQIGAKVFIRRGHDEYGAGYVAWACTMSNPNSGVRTDINRLGPKRDKSCSASVWGKTPTAAYKKALIALGKKKELR